MTAFNVDKNIQYLALVPEEAYPSLIENYELKDGKFKENLHQLVHDTNQLIKYLEDNGGLSANYDVARVVQRARTQWAYTWELTYETAKRSYLHKTGTSYPQQSKTWRQKKEQAWDEFKLQHYVMPGMTWEKGQLESVDDPADKIKEMYELEQER